jgi:magnesium chelatase family protein
MSTMNISLPEELKDFVDNQLQFTARRFNLSARVYGRILRVARTIADLVASDNVTVHHVSEALLFRQLDANGLDSLA